MIKCPNCGKQNQDHYKFCLGCGEELPRDSTKAAAPSTAPTPPSGMPALGMPPGAGARVEPKGAPARPQAAPPVASSAQVVHREPKPAAAAPAAPAAAAPAAPAAPSPAPAPAPAPAPHAAAPAPAKKAQACPSCGADVPPDFTFCGRCGARMGAGAAAAPEQAAPAAPKAPEGVVRGKVVMIQPNGAEGVSVPIMESGTVVGRDKGEEFREDYFLSPGHAKFTIEGSSLFVDDMESLNGIYFRLLPETTYELVPGDFVRIGQEVIRFELLPDPVAQETPILGGPRRDIWGRVSLVLGRDKIGNAYTIDGKECLVGRERGNIVFADDGYVSGLHLRIWREADKYFITDLKSSNGTYLRIRRRREVKGGDYLLIGQFLYRVDF